MRCKALCRPLPSVLGGSNPLDDWSRSRRHRRPWGQVDNRNEGWQYRNVFQNVEEVRVAVLLGNDEDVQAVALLHEGFEHLREGVSPALPISQTKSQRCPIMIGGWIGRRRLRAGFMGVRKHSPTGRDKCGRRRWVLRCVNRRAKIQQAKTNKQLLRTCATLWVSAPRPVPPFAKNLRTLS